MSERAIGLDEVDMLTSLHRTQVVCSVVKKALVMVMVMTVVVAG